MTNIISISALNLNLNNKRVLDGINLEVKQGENLILMGSSGSGKSVLTKTIIGFFPYRRGSIKIEGNEVVSSVEHNVKLHKIGFVFQNNALFDSLPIWENISFGLLQKHKIARKLAREKVAAKLNLVGLNEDIVDKFPDELSGGMQKRIAILRTVILQPKIIIFDEPTSGLDPITSDTITEFILSIAGDVTKVIITHDVKLAKKILGNLAILSDGKIVWHGTIDETRESVSTYLKYFT
ncbi:MAG: ATP-binding cassette domain-containing protein [Rickettsiaceae bacterium H1]|nr:ATP-binding cassette domain-containing protein [Rickettsiaceae bacterium H1]